MARRKWKASTARVFDRTVERVAIATIAAITARASEGHVAITAAFIFLVVVGVEELGKRITWDGRSRDLRYLAYNAFMRGRVSSSRTGTRVRVRRRRNAH